MYTLVSSVRLAVDISVVSSMSELTGRLYAGQTTAVQVGPHVLGPANGESAIWCISQHVTQ